MKSCYTLMLCIALSSFHTVNAQCGGSGYQYDHVGFYSDGSGNSNYGNFESCSWLFESRIQGQVRLGFYDFDTEEGFDFLRIYDGQDANAPLIASLSGDAVGGTQYFTTGPFAYVEWSTDGSVTAPGFNGWWDSYSANFETCEGSITDGAGDYDNDIVYRYTIQPPGAETIILDLTYMDTEANFDYVYVYDGLDASAPLIGSYSGTTSVYGIEATSGSMYIEFDTDGSVTEGGFGGNYYCSFCDGNTALTAATGSIEDGSEGNNYANNTSCSWHITSEGANFIDIDITSMDAESCCDYLRIYDGPNSTAPLLETVTGSSIPQDIRTTDGEAFIEFTSDGSITGEGWSLNYSSNFPCSESNSALTACSGTLEDGSGDRAYASNSYCTWLINPLNAEGLTLSFNSFDLGVGDFVRIYDGVDASGPMLAEYGSGAQTSFLEALSGKAFVVFETDESGRGDGFSLEYSCSPLSINAAHDLGSIKVFPNPSRSVLNIDLGGLDINDVQWAMYNISGETVQLPKVFTNGSSVQIQTNELASGMYILRIQGNDGQEQNFNVAIVH